MIVSEAVRCVQEYYPRLFFACHRRHVRDPKSRRRLSGHQASILDHLDDVEPISLAALAAHMGVTPSTMSLNVDRLEQAGFVVRQRDRQDARRVHLRLTAAGVRIKESQSVLDPERLRQVLDRLSDEERRQAVHGLALLARASTQVGDPQRWFGKKPRRAGK